jgi:hypothetical protein
MPRQHSLSLVVLVVVVALASPAPRQGISQPSQPLTAPAPTRSAQMPEKVPVSVGANRRRASAATSPEKQSDLPDSANPLFLAPVYYASGGGAPGSVVIADVNGDGKPDLVVADDCGPNSCSTEGEVGVLLGNGDGTFKPVLTYGSGGNAFYGSRAAVADINGDGKKDIVVSNYCSVDGCAEGTIGVLLGNGDGTFQPVMVSDFAGDASSLAIADVNGDGKPDLLVTIPSGGFAVLLGNGDGTFQSAGRYSSGGQNPTWISVNDVNGDGKLDVVVGNVGPPYDSPVTVGVLLGNGDGTFQPVVSYDGGGGQSNIAIAVADVNGDTKPDIIVAEDVLHGGYFGSGLVAVLLGNGDGTFQSAVTYDSGGRGVGGVALADVNGDGKPDVIVANGCLPQGIPCGEGVEGVIGVLLGNGDGTLQAALTYDSGELGQVVPLGTSSALAVSDLNGDGLPDLVAAGCMAAGCGGGNEVGIFLHVGTTATNTTVTSTPNPSGFGQTVTFAATVTSGSGTPTGTVSFSDGSTTLGSAMLINGSASIIQSLLNPGSHSITATYQGSVQFNSSTSGPVLQVITPATTTTSVISSRNPAPINAPVKYTATVVTEYGAWLTGTVSFRDGGVVVATISLTGNQATYRTSYPIGGTHAITAVYSGDIDNRGGTSPILTEYIPTTTSTTLASSLNPSIYGQSVTWTATVTPTGSTAPTGTVRFTWENHTVGTVSLSSGGVATLTRSNLNADSYPLTAVYMGDAYNLGSTSPVVNEVVTEAASSATLTSSPNPSASGQAVTFTAIITSPTVKPTGPVTFSAGKVVLGTAQISNGKATLTTSTLLTGSTTVTATYSGDSNIAGSSASVTQVVQ